MDVTANTHTQQLDNTNVDQTTSVQPDVITNNPQQQSNEEPTENVDAELEAMKKRLQQMEQETMGMHSGNGGSEDSSMQTDNTNENSNGQQQQQQQHSSTNNNGNFTGVDEMTADSDARSIYVGNVDYSATGEELNQHFQECGTINRVTIMCHKATGQPKGYAYIEFKERESVQNALILNESMFRGRPLKVVEKRTNIPGVTRGGMRGRGRYNRGGWRGNFRGRPRGRGRARGGGGRWAPTQQF